MNIVLLGRLHEGEISFGPQKVAQQLYTHLLKNNINVEFIEYYFKIYKDSTLLKRFFGYEVFTDNVKRLGIIQLFIYLFRTNPDVIHIVTLERYILSIFLYKFLLRSKIIVTYHSILKYELSTRKNKPTNFGKLKDYLLEYLTIKFSDRLIFLSTPHHNLARKFYKFSEKKVNIVPNGVETLKKRRIKEFNFSRGLNIVFYYGGGEKDRGFEQLLFVLENVKVPVTLYVLGKIECYSFSSDFVKIDNLKLMPHDELYEFLTEIHLVIKSNVVDEFSLFVGECMTMSLIPVISDKIGISEYIVNEANGFVYNSENIEEVKTILENIYNGQYDIQTIAHNAQNIVEQLDWNKVAQQYLEVYKSVIGCKTK